jgi:hypothetical protein
MHRALVLLLLSACATPSIQARTTAPGTGSAREVRIEVVDASGRELPAPRSGAFDEIAHLTVGRTVPRLSTADAFSAAAAAGLRARGVTAVGDRNVEIPTFRVTILDFEIRNHDAAGAVAFVSAAYLLHDPRNQSHWEAAQTRLPIRLGGPDLTRSELTRIATEAVNRALSSFPAGLP